jgi:hypothetical protein
MIDLSIAVLCMLMVALITALIVFVLTRNYGK